MKIASLLICLWVSFLSPGNSFAVASREQVLRDSTIKYGVSIEPFLKSLNKGKIIEGFNYAPHINKFLKEHKYVKFPPYRLTIGIDTTFPSYKSHLVIKSGNRLYFPKGSELACPADLKTNGYMVFIAWDVRDVFIDGINIIGSKANDGYKTSMYGSGISMYGSTNVLLTNTKISKSSGDGIAVRVQWRKQSENITIKNLTVTDATRVGMLITGIINGKFTNIHIEGTGEKDKSKIVKPQTALSFEPNDCTSKYVNCRFTNLVTKNNIGPVVATTNFYNIYTKNTCGRNDIDVVIQDWQDFTLDKACYGATFDISSGDMSKYNTEDINGTFKIINPVFHRDDNYYYFHGEAEPRKGGVKYTMSNLRVVHGGKKVNFKSRNKDVKIKSMIDRANSKNRISIR